MTTDKHVFFNEGEMAKAKAECERLEVDGWTKVPDWFPVPTAGYEYELPGQVFAYMKPKPKWWHVFRYRVLRWPKRKYWQWKTLRIRGSIRKFPGLLEVKDGKK